jgi:hypothetical protein
VEDMTPAWMLIVGSGVVVVGSGDVVVKNS